MCRRRRVSVFNWEKLKIKNFSIKKNNKNYWVLFFDGISLFERHATDYRERCDIKNGTYSDKDIRKRVTIRENNY